MSEETNNVKLNLKDSDLELKLKSIINRFKDFKIIEPEEILIKPEILIIELENNPEKVLNQIEAALKSGKIKEAFVLSNYTDPKILMRAMRIGIKEYFTVPIDENEFVAALARFKDRRNQFIETSETKKSGKIISIIGSKGGVGTTTIAVNLAVALKDAVKKETVALVD